jgi:hypothetical protein
MLTVSGEYATASYIPCIYLYSKQVLDSNFVLDDQGELLIYDNLTIIGMACVMGRLSQAESAIFMLFCND